MHDREAGIQPVLGAVLRREPDAAARPGRLRALLQAESGGDALRREIHQVVAAAEEHLPATLTRLAPLTTAACDRVAGELAAGRGWTRETARTVTATWAKALGLEVPSAPPAPTPARPVVASPTAEVAATMPPPGRTMPPPRATPGVVPGQAAPAAPTAWPEPRTRHVQQLGGRRDIVSTTLAYAGMPFVPFVVALVALTVLLCMPVIFLDRAGFLLPALGALGAGLLVRRLRMGLLVATEAGVEFVPLDGPSRTPRIDGTVGAPWPEVTVTPGFVSVVRFGDHRIQVGPRNRLFARAAAGARP